MKLLLADDEPDMIRALSAILTHEGYKVDAVYDGAEALEKAAAVSYDGLILDIMMPKLDGLAVLSALRDKDILTPVLLLTAKSQTEDKISGLDCGADDYLTKPFGVMELISRVKALLRRSRALQDDKQLVLGDITLDSERREVHVGGELCELTFKEFELLKLLMVNAGIVLHRDTIMSDVWGTDYEGESRTLDMHIKTLRQKLGEAGNMIKTVRNVGYKME